MLFDRDGSRKYMIAPEWRSFLAAADTADPETRAFCWTLARTGARLSEVLALSARSFDIENTAVRIRCLKRRTVGIIREIPLDDPFLEVLSHTMDLADRRADPLRADLRLWPWSRTTAWSRVRDLAERAGLPDHLCMPKALRHTFGIEGVMNQNVPLGVMKKWMGHSRIESTVVYTTPVGWVVCALAHRMWS